MHGNVVVCCFLLEVLYDRRADTFVAANGNDGDINKVKMSRSVVNIASTDGLLILQYHTMNSIWELDGVRGALRRPLHTHEDLCLLGSPAPSRHFLLSYRCVKLVQKHLIFRCDRSKQ